MVTPSLIALLGFIGWALFLLVLMEVIRAWLTLSGQVAANAFTPDNAGLSPFMQRLARAHANCVEGLPIFGGLLLVAILTGRSDVTDPLACVFLAARMFQSLVHLVSVSSAMVTVRFLAFSVQMGIAAYWLWRLLVPVLVAGTTG
ncbi:MAG TPA: MAPEG family protein [Arenimonas sp.]|jgi:uncharacterized MAPEG superfamily protein|nr:MAPEG family protein [Arenimonas sp.]